MSSSRLIKNNHLRGDFVFRDVYKRHAFSTFAGNEHSESSTLYINENQDPVNCTSQISTYKDGVGTVHLYTRNGQDFDKTNAANATVSINSVSTIFRSSNTHVNGGFSVKSLLKINPSTNRVGVNQTNPAYTLDVNGDCNISGNILVNGNALSFSTSSATFGTTTPSLYQGPGEELTEGLSFVTSVETKGDTIVTASDSFRTFTFEKQGLYLVQTQVRGTVPWLPEGDVSTYFIKNGDTTQKLAMETIPHDGASALACAKTYLVQAEVGDTLRFIIDSVASNTYTAGIQECSIAFFEYKGAGGTSSQAGNFASLNVEGDVTVQGNAIVQGHLTTNLVQTASGNLRLETASPGSVFSTSIYNSTTAAGASVSITGTPGLLQRTTSSLRYKTSVENLQDQYSQQIYQLRPVWYRSLCENDRKDWGWYGLIAEEVAQVDPRLCFWGPDGLVEGVMYDRIVPLLLKEQGKLVARIENLEHENRLLKQKIDKIQESLKL